MHLLAPLALIAVAPLAAAIIALYLLKLRRRDQVVPSVFLWRRAVQDLQANTPFQKLRANLLLILQLLALIALVAGLAGPCLMARHLGGGNVVIVLDASASMKATDVPGSRFQEAKRMAEQIVRGLGRRDEAALLVCSHRPRIALSFSRDRARLLSALHAATPTDCRTNIRDGLLLALSLCAKRPDSQVYLISDGAFPPLPEVTSPAEVRFVRVGLGADNVALLALEVSRPSPDKPAQLFVRLRNYAAESKRGTLSVSLDEDLMSAAELELAPGESRTESYETALPRPGLVMAELELADDLAADNVAYTFAQQSSAIRVLLVTPGNLFLEQALLVMPGLGASKAASLSGADSAAVYRDYDVVIFDRVAPPPGPTTGAVMAIGIGLPAVASLGPELVGPSITSWEDNHPALRFVNLGAAQIARGRRLLPAAGAVAIARSGEAPIIVAREAPDLRALVLGWDVLDSDLPLRVGFPVLLSNAIQWLAQGRGDFAGRRVGPGEIVTFAAPPGPTDGEMLRPDGTRERLPIGDGILAISSCDEVGPYRLRAGDREWRWAVDLRDEDESNLEPGDRLQLGERVVAAGGGPPLAEQHLWPLLAALALLALLIEWHLYHRRA